MIIAGTLAKIVVVAAGAALGWAISKRMSSFHRTPEPPFGYHKSYDTARAPSPERRRQPPSYKLNFNGSVSNQKTTAGTGFIIRNQSNGEPEISASYNLNHLYRDLCDITVAEAMGLKLGLEMAIKEGIQLSLIQGNRTDVIKWVKGEESKIPKAYVQLIKEIKDLMKECGIKLDEIEEVEGEKYNKVASKLAEMGRIWAKPDQIFPGRFGLPDKVSKLIDEDIEASLFSRKFQKIKKED